MTDVLVSVIVVTYNHEPFIATALESVLAQRIEAPVEILISEDGSTDRTRTTVQEFASRHGPRVRLLLSSRNLNTNEVTTRAIQAARGRYLAILDGDDYWTSPDKLRRQLAFLAAHPECSACFHDAAVVDAAGDVIEPTFVRRGVAAITDLDDILVGNYVPGCAAVFRASALSPMEAWVRDAPYGDWALLIQAARHGRLGFLDEVLGAYRRHRGGAWSGLDEVEQASGIVHFFEFLAEHIWPDRLALVRRVRAGWRINLFKTLERRGDDRGLTRAIDEGVRAGDVCRVRAADIHAAEASSSPSPARIRLRIKGLPATSDALPPSSPPAAGHLDDARFSPDGKVLTAYGWGPFPDDDPGPLLVVESGDQVEDAVLARLVRPDVAEVVGPMLWESGFWLRVVASSAFRSPIRLVAVDSRGRRQTIGSVHPPL